MRSDVLKWIPAGAVLSPLVLCLACGTVPPMEIAEVLEAPRDGVFVHISHGPQHAHRVLMGLRMAEMMSADRDVLVYLDIRGVEVVFRDQVVEMEGFESSTVMIRRLLEAGVPIYVCPTCLEKAGESVDALMEGVRLADRERFFDFTQGRILTLGY